MENILSRIITHSFTLPNWYSYFTKHTWSSSNVVYWMIITKSCNVISVFTLGKIEPFLRNKILYHWTSRFWISWYYENFLRINGQNTYELCLAFFKRLQTLFILPLLNESPNGYWRNLLSNTQNVSNDRIVILFLTLKIWHEK